MTGDTASFVCKCAGTAGSIMFAFCNLPTIMKIMKTKSVKDVSLMFIIMSLLGNICCATYVFQDNLARGGWQLPLYLNYGMALTLCIILLRLWFKYK